VSEKYPASSGRLNPALIDIRKPDLTDNLQHLPSPRNPGGGRLSACPLKPSGLKVTEWKSQAKAKGKL